MFVRRKLVNGQPRNYAVWTFREGGKVRQRQIYLGRFSTLAQRILDLERALFFTQVHEADYLSKIARKPNPRPYVIERLSSIRRQAVAIRTAIDRLIAAGREFALLPSEEEYRQLGETLEASRQILLKRGWTLAPSRLVDQCSAHDDRGDTITVGTTAPVVPR